MEPNGTYPTVAVAPMFGIDRRVRQRTRARVLATDFARALLDRSTLLSQEGAGKAECRPRTHGPLRERMRRRRPHSSIQVAPITRPSLRDGRTAYAVLSREPSSLWPPSPREFG